MGIFSHYILENRNVDLLNRAAKPMVIALPSLATSNPFEFMLL